MELEEVYATEKPTATTYEWLSSNPLASSCGTALSSIYCASRDYNKVTQCTIGGVESIVNYAAGTAKPVYEIVVEKLEKPSMIIIYHSYMYYNLMWNAKRGHL